MNDLAYTLAEHGGPIDEALTFAQRAIERVPDDPRFQDTLGWIYFRKGMYPAALKFLEQSASRGDAVAEQKLHLALAYIKTGDMRRGRETLNAALRLDPKLLDAAAAMQMLGRMER